MGSNKVGWVQRCRNHRIKQRGRSVQGGPQATYLNTYKKEVPVTYIDIDEPSSCSYL